jgi:hypothetical protein
MTNALDPKFVLIKKRGATPLSYPPWAKIKIMENPDD